MAITNDQGILICEACQEKVRTDLNGDRICVNLWKVGYCPDLGLEYEPPKSKSPRTGKQKDTYNVKL